MKCPKCGAELSEDTKFCSYCGAKIEESSNDIENTALAMNEKNNFQKPDIVIPKMKDFEQKKSIADKLRDKGLEFWNGLNIFGKISTIAMVLFILLCLLAFLTGKVVAGVISIMQIALIIVAVLMHKGVVKSPNSWLKYILLIIAVVFTVLNIMSYSWGSGKSTNNQFTEVPHVTTTNESTNNEENDAEETIADTNFTIDKGTEYAYMSDEWNVYIATAISDSIVKVENWGKSLSSSKSVKYGYDIGTYKINDSENGFSWVDDEHTAFYLTLQDKNNSRLKKPQSKVFTVNINDSDKFKGTDYDEKIICYSYTNDDWHMYRAIPLTESLVKIECWSRSSSADSFCFGYDVGIIDLNNTDTDFEWTDDEHTAFTITMKDVDNDHYWKKDTFVAFTNENESFVYTNVKSYLDSFVAGEDEVAVPASASSYKYKDYQNVQKELTSVGFTNISTVIQYDIVLGWTSEGEIESVSIDGGTNYEKGAIFKKDAMIIITYHMKEEDNPSKKNKETTTAPETTSEETVAPTETQTETSTKDDGVVLPQSGSKLAKDLDTKGSSTIYYINVDGTTNVPKLANWEDAVVTDSVSEYLDYLQSQGYTVSITGTDYREPYSGFHAYDTNFKVENSTTSWTMSLYIQDEKYVEYELDVNLP